MGLLDRVEAVLGLADDDHVRLLADQGRDGPPEQRLVIDQQDADRGRCLHRSPRSGIRPGRDAGIIAMTRVPRPGAESMVKVPPTSSIRSRIVCRP